MYVFSQTSVVPSGSNTHAFDINAETEPIEESEHYMADLPADIEDMAVEGAFGEDNAGTWGICLVCFSIITHL